MKLQGIQRGPYNLCCLGGLQPKDMVAALQGRRSGGVDPFEGVDTTSLSSLAPNVLGLE